MAKIVGSEGRVHAVDFDQRAIDRVERKAKRQGMAATVAAHAVSASEIDFIPTASVDFLLAEGLLCCMKDHAGAMGQIKRVLKEGGRAYLSIIKFTREDDPRSVSKSEWTTLLSQMRIVDSGEGLMSRWALVSPN
jgi:ubiquinone/menaquinone biosynthesis C-methylase UbiE